MVVTTSGAPGIGPVTVVGGGLLLPGFLSPGVVVVPVMIGVVPTAAAVDVSGMLNGLLWPALIGPGFTQVTVLPLVVQLQPLPGLKLAGVVTPAGIETVVVIGPVVGAVPWLVTVTGNWLVTPSFKTGEG